MRGGHWGTVGVEYTGQAQKVEMDLRCRWKTVYIWVEGWVRGVMFEGKKKP